LIILEELGEVGWFKTALLLGNWKEGAGREKQKRMGVTKVPGRETLVLIRWGSTMKEPNRRREAGGEEVYNGVETKAVKASPHRGRVSKIREERGPLKKASRRFGGKREEGRSEGQWEIDAKWCGSIKLPTLERRKERHSGGKDACVLDQVE